MIRTCCVKHMHGVLFPTGSLRVEVNAKLQLLTQYDISICSTSYVYLMLSKVRPHHINDATF